MKIYANTTGVWAELSDFEPYVGKDVWVECAFPNTRIGYIRILYIDAEGDWVGVNTYFPEDPNYLGRKSHLRTVRFHPSNLKIFPPITPIPTEKLIGESEPVDSTIYKFEGKPYWIRCHWTENDGLDIPYYVKILSIDGMLVHMKHIESWYVEDYDPEGETLEPSKHLRGPKTVRIECLSVDSPLEVLSDEELDDMLAVNDEAFINSEGDWSDDAE